MKTPILIRADASAAIGTGHVMRCLALAQAWQQAGGVTTFAQAENTPALEQRLQSDGMEVAQLVVARGSADDAAQTVELARARGATWVVADGYCFDSAWQKQIRAAGLRLLLIDDYGQAEHYHANVVLNQNLSADASLYVRRDPDTQLLLGPRYALLRREFWDILGTSRAVPEIGRKVLVTMGGSDPDQVTAQVVAALQGLMDVEAVVVIGGSNPHVGALQSSIGAANPALRLVVSATNMPELMAWADVAVTAAGSTSWELAYLGLPALQIVVADNQLGIGAALDRAGVTISLGDFRTTKVETITARLRQLLSNVAVRREMSARGQRLVDGHGASRVVAALGNQLKFTLVSDVDSWINEYLGTLKSGFETEGHSVRWVHNPKEIEAGDIAFLLSLSRVVPRAVLRRNAHNLVVHESALPHGRGWSPLTWQILEGKREIPISLLEAAESVDSGEIYSQGTMQFHGHEWVKEIRAIQAQATIELCRDFVARYPFVCGEGRKQVGEPTYYKRRGPADSRIDPDKTFREQFNLLRVADPERYPAFFELDGRRYEVRVSAL